jgi:argininosuccinate lyase
MKLWQTDANADQKVEKFTVGTDFLLDLELVEWDCLASKAHARMLAKIGIISDDEACALCAGLDEILALHSRGEFIIRQEDEDCHTAIENHLVMRCGEAGLKIHTGRSRNDQVLTALRLYSKHKCTACAGMLDKLVATLEDFAAANDSVPLPGYTHTRKAMPSSVAMWAGSFHDAFADDLALLQHVTAMLDQNPLGTGAGYGVPLPLDRLMTTAELGFARVMENPIYAHNSRGKFEGMVLNALVQALLDINRMASDLILFTMPGFDYFSLPGSFMTGSSIMPQKKNPDVLELLRGKYHELFACELQVRSTTVNLISGYHRDLQLTKEALMRGFAIALESMEMAALVAGSLSVNRDRCQAAMTEELYATAKAYHLVQQGIPFREAYRIIAAQYRDKGADDEI